MSIYEEMKNAGVEIDSWQSDMFVPISDITKEIASRYKFKNMITTFIDNITKTRYFSIPFAYSPYWQNKLGLCGEQKVKQH